MGKDGAFDRDRVLVYARKFFLERTVMEKENHGSNIFFSKGKNFSINQAWNKIEELRIRYILTKQKTWDNRWLNSEC